jgi:hypothetical protein
VRDEELRALERQALAGDERARLHVARALARTEQLFSVLGRLDLGRVPWAEYERHRALVDALWLEHLRGLAPVLRVASEWEVTAIVVASRAELIGWTNLGTGPMVACSRTGSLLAMGDARVNALKASEDAVFVQHLHGDVRHFQRVQGEPRELDPIGVHGTLLDVGPRFGLMAGTGVQGNLWIIGPESEPVLARPGPTRHVSIAWGSNEAVHVRGGPWVAELVSFAGPTSTARCSGRCPPASAAAWRSGRSGTVSSPTSERVSSSAEPAVSSFRSSGRGATSLARSRATRGACAFISMAARVASSWTSTGRCW